MPPFDPHVVALDAQALREGAWPRPSARLNQLVELAGQFGPHFWLIQGALDEVRGNFLRTASGAVAGFEKAIDAARRRGLSAEGRCTGLDELAATWDQRSREAVAAMRCTVVPYTNRPVQEFFASAIDRVPPFAENGAGFRDAVILASLADEMSRMGLTSAILVSADSDFRSATPPVPGQDIRIMTLTGAIDNFEKLSAVRRGQVFEELLAASHHREARAKQAMLADKATLDAALAELLEVESSNIPELGGLLKQPLSYSIADVLEISIKPLFEEVPTGTRVDASAALDVSGKFEILPFTASVEARLRLRQDRDDALGPYALGGTLERWLSTPTVVERRFLVGVDLQLTRTADGYTDLAVNRVRPFTAAQRAIRKALLQNTEEGAVVHGANDHEEH